jgi:hypothetical protein
MLAAPVWAYSPRGRTRASPEASRPAPRSRGAFPGARASAGRRRGRGGRRGTAGARPGRDRPCCRRVGPLAGHVGFSLAATAVGNRGRDPVSSFRGDDRGHAVAVAGVPQDR